jgi:hypothetical protein
MHISERKLMQQRVGFTGDDVDGDWGPQSRAALRAHLRSLMPNPNPWPGGSYKEKLAFYGPPGESNLVSFDFPYPMYYGGKRVLRSRAHRLVVPSLLRILQNIGERISQEPTIQDEAEDYGGIYNFRNKRAGSSLSNHAWGIAIDLDADDNSFRDPWPLVSDMPLTIIEEFAKEGWTSAAAFWGYDAMHNEAIDPFK